MTDPMKTLDDSGRPAPTPVSQKTYAIAGISVTVHGLEELNSTTKNVACLWLLHPRLASQERMAGIAASAIGDWNSNPQSKSTKGLIAVSFDQRNHGKRLIDPLANEAWRQGNPRHAQDMFSVFQGTARDTSLLMDYLASFIFPNDEHLISENLVLGVSLGGHAAWSCLLHDPRMTAGVIIIGCPDYLNLMVDRARLSKLPSWTKSSPPGSEILGSEAFPFSFVETVKRYDPASLFLGAMDSVSKSTSSTSSTKSPGPARDSPLPEPTKKEQEQLRPLLSRCLAGKRILNISGGSDKLVPYHRGEVFLTWFKKAIAADGWFGDGGVTFEDIIDQSAGHEVTANMADEAIRFISETLAVGNQGKERRGSVRESKI
ncbi:uncharacterized protein N7469_005247 [Penicillium citrinum]|uniref:AB hydrolase-1 domain-containing protein n=2 Tax=Penicillium TaxID=5073 RepID=A0A9W9TNV5_PENCI|nr:uncharacterized protein N7469_005247 [Penicillium citrinum]KAJ5233481.1 hypothetical protein N7469_005247 [Penicillium citrinum]KAJ5573048.1 hypothetical protein N7450_010032 [Penicillium hetheringtonii]